MKHVALAGALALALAGCNQTVQPPGPVIQVPDQYQSLINAVHQACGFLPNVASAAAILTQYDFQSAVSAICGAANLFKAKRSFARGKPVLLHVGPVAVQGRFA